jgi:RNA polymerase sigma-70 factor (ECF subfamily)
MEFTEEQEVLEAVQSGRKERFEAIVVHYQRRAFRIAMSLVQNTQDAMDLAQEAFLRAFRAIQTFDTRQPFFPWFYRILRNLCLSHLKRRRRLFSLSGPKADEDDSDIEVPSDSPGPEVLAERSEKIDRFYAEFQTLPARDREILSLRHFENLTYAEIAAALEIPVGTVMSRLFYARRKLKERLGADLDD